MIIFLLILCFLLLPTIFSATKNYNFVSCMSLFGPRAMSYTIVVCLDEKNFLILKQPIYVVVNGHWLFFLLATITDYDDWLSILIFICSLLQLWIIILAKSGMHIVFGSCKISFHSHGFCCHFLILYPSVSFGCVLSWQLHVLVDSQLQFTDVCEVVLISMGASKHKRKDLIVLQGSGTVMKLETLNLLHKI